jgi:hypothetical protein
LNNVSASSAAKAVAETVREAKNTTEKPILIMSS